MKITIVLSLLSLSVFSQEVHWLNNIDSAKTLSTENRKIILLKFSGSDWCANCKRLDHFFFETEEFKKFATEILVLLEADFPLRKKNKLSDEQQAHNDQLANKFNKQGDFPLVLILNDQGKLLGKIDTRQNDIQAYFTQIKTYKIK
jgi:thioredoxin-related protein